MTVAFSTSSPCSSVALISSDREILWSGGCEAPGRASEACMHLLRSGLAESGLQLESAELFLADLGPGSFTGVRVGIVLAKTLAWNFQTKCAGLDAFDLVDPGRTVAIPSRKHEFFLRIPGAAVAMVKDLPSDAIGWGFDDHKDFPKASQAQLSEWLLRDPVSLMPEYLTAPSISTPKRPLSRLSG